VVRASCGELPARDDDCFLGGGADCTVTCTIITLTQKLLSKQSEAVFDCLI
jgi:hypothetical protein